MGEKCCRDGQDPQARRGDAAREPAFLRRGRRASPAAWRRMPPDEEKDAAKKALKEGVRRRSSSRSWLRMPTATSTTPSVRLTAQHASTYADRQTFPNDKMFGYLMENEVKAISAVMEKPAHPFCAIVGGSKVSSKIGVIKALIEKRRFDHHRRRHDLPSPLRRAVRSATSICEPDMSPVALEILELAKEKGVQLVMSYIPDGWGGSRTSRPRARAFREHPWTSKDHPLERPRGRIRDRQNFATGSQGGGPGHRRGYRRACLLAHRRRRLGSLHQKQVRPSYPLPKKS